MFLRSDASSFGPARSARHPNLVRVLLAILTWGALADIARGIAISGYSSAANDRFASGYTSNPVTAPVPNTNPLFIGLGFNWSGVGWDNTNLTKSFGMISPRHFLVATHYGGASSICFLGANGQLYSATQQSVRGTGAGPASDVSLGTLTADIPASAQVAYYPVLDLAPALSLTNYAAYVGQNLLVYGRTGSVGSNKTSSLALFAPGYAITSNASPVAYQIGDSGSPLFIPWASPSGASTLTLLGAAWAVDNASAPTVNFHSFLPDTGAATQLNLLMAEEGYALRWVGTPTSTWKGSSSSQFNRTTNWTPSQIPADAYVAFSGTSTIRRSLSLGANQSLRGLVFKTAAGVNGFTFAAGNTLTIGRGGILNLDADSPQTFQCDIALADAQWWDSGDGGVTLTGAVNNNGYLLVIDGRAGTVFSGVVSGSGGLAKEGYGTLTLGANNSFGGALFVHNGTVNLTGSAGNSYAGGTIVSSGTLLANNLTGSATGTGPVTVAAGAALSGSGTLAPSGANDITINGCLSPGDNLTAATLQFAFTTGRLLFADSASLVFNAGDTSDLLQFSNGQVALGGTLQIVQGAGFSAFRSYPVFSGLSAAPAGTFGSVSGVPAGFSPAFSFSAGVYSLSFAPTTFATWQQAHFTSAEIAAGKADDLADPDGDEIPNLMEYALGLDPHSASRAGIPVVDASGAYLTLTVSKNPNATDVIYSVETTGDLTNANGWSSATTTVLVDNATTLVVRDNTAIGSAPARFIRLRVTR